MAERVAGIVLAGGRSTRMGHDKASLEVGGVSLLQRTAARLAPCADEVLVVARAGQRLPTLDLPVPYRIVTDRYADAGPLGGIATGMAASEAPCFIVLACDMPLVDPALVRRLLGAVDGHDAAVSTGPDGRDEPLCAVYRRTCLLPIERRLAEGVLKVTAFYGLCDVLRVSTDDAVAFANVNTPEDLVRIGELLRREGARPADDPGV